MNYINSMYLISLLVIANNSISFDISSNKYLFNNVSDDNLLEACRVDLPPFPDFTLEEEGDGKKQTDALSLPGFEEPVQEQNLSSQLNVQVPQLIDDTTIMSYTDFEQPLSLPDLPLSFEEQRAALLEKKGEIDFAAIQQNHLLRELQEDRRFTITIEEDAQEIEDKEKKEQEAEAYKKAQEQAQEYVKKENDVYKCKWNGCKHRAKRNRMCIEHILFKHLKIKPFTCDQCDQPFTRDRERKRHQSRCVKKVKRLQDRGIESCNCPDCGRLLTKKGYLKTHQKIYCRLRSLELR